MIDDLFRADAYLRDCEARIVRIDEAGIVLDRTVFYPLGGGQAGDSGVLLLADGRTLAIADTRKAKDAEGKATAEILHVPAPDQAGIATDLLCHLVAQPVNACSITPEHARLDFHMTDPLDKDAQIDFQPCGGTHVANTAEIGRMVVTKIEKKSANSRRVVLGWAPA